MSIATRIQAAMTVASDIFVPVFLVSSAVVGMGFVLIMAYPAI